jgi:hypothetical protein
MDQRPARRLRNRGLHGALAPTASAKFRRCHDHIAILEGLGRSFGSGFRERGFRVAPCRSAAKQRVKLASCKWRSTWGAWPHGTLGAARSCAVMLACRGPGGASARLHMPSRGSLAPPPRFCAWQGCGSAPDEAHAALSKARATRGNGLRPLKIEHLCKAGGLGTLSAFIPIEAAQKTRGEVSHSLEEPCCIGQLFFSSSP